MSRLPLRVLAIVAWGLLLIAFWLGARGSDVGPIRYLLEGLDRVAERPWAPVALLIGYTLRPLLLVPITVLNLASGFVLGVIPGVASAVIGTLLSATIGYAIGRGLGSAEAAEDLSRRWPLVRLLRRRGFEAVLAGGLMYLHADMVNLPSGLLRIRFPVFLAGIVLGNALTLTTAVLAGASVDGDPADATLQVDLAYVAVAAALFLVSVGLAYWLRRRLRPMA